VGISVVVGAVVSWRFRRLDALPVVTGLVLWFSFGGHWVELWYLNWLRPRLTRARVFQMVARVAVWFVGGVCLGIGVALSMRLSPLTRHREPPVWWVAGLVFVGVELVAHLALFARRRPNFYSGAG